MLDEKELITRVIALNDQQAFSWLVRLHQSGIRQFLRRLTAGDHHAADDLAQETFITLHQKIAGFRAESSLNTWLHKIAFRHFLRWRQKAYQAQEVNGDALPESSYTESNQDLLMEQLMAKLSVDERSCITLSVSVGMSHPEIAEVTGMPLGTVKSHINRARQKLTALVSVSSETRTQHYG